MNCMQEINNIYKHERPDDQTLPWRQHVDWDSTIFSVWDQDSQTIDFLSLMWAVARGFTQSVVEFSRNAPYCYFTFHAYAL